MTAQIIHLADYRPCRINPQGSALLRAVPMETPDGGAGDSVTAQNSPAKASGTARPPCETSGGDTAGWGLPEALTGGAGRHSPFSEAAAPALAPGPATHEDTGLGGMGGGAGRHSPRLFTIGDRVKVCRHGQPVDGIIIRIGGFGARLLVTIGEGRERGLNVWFETVDVRQDPPGLGRSEVRA
jgi:hypothetical protein